MSAGPEDARGLRLASNGNASVPPRDTEKLARLRRARKEAARDIEAERRMDDARVTELHAQLDAKLRERNERRARLLRQESERIGVEREVRFAHAAAERADAATRLDVERGDETAKKEARRAAFLARRRHPGADGVAKRDAAAEERWERLNETAAVEAARTPRLRETPRPVAHDVTSARAFRETNEGEGEPRRARGDEDFAAAFESVAAVSAASPVETSAPRPPAFEFAPPSERLARIASPSRENAGSSGDASPPRVRGAPASPSPSASASASATASARAAGHTFSALGTYATDSPDPTRLMAGEEAEVASRAAFRRVALELAEPERRAARAARAVERDAVEGAFETRAGRVFGSETAGLPSLASGDSPDSRADREPRLPAEAWDARRERRRGRRGRRRPETRREKMFGKFPFRVAGAALDATRAVGGGALRGVGGILRGLRGIVRGGDEDDAEEPSPRGRHRAGA